MGHKYVPIAAPVTLTAGNVERDYTHAQWVERLVLENPESFRQSLEEIYQGGRIIEAFKQAEAGTPEPGLARAAKLLDEDHAALKRVAEKPAHGYPSPLRDARTNEKLDLPDAVILSFAEPITKHATNELPKAPEHVEHPAEQGSAMAEVRVA